MNKFQDRFISLRKNPDTARAGLKWLANEDEELMKHIRDKASYEDIAKHHKRTLGGVKIRAMQQAIIMMERDDISIEKASSLINISQHELQDFISKPKDKPKSVKKSETKSDDKYMKILMEIRDLLKEITESKR